MSTLDKSIRVYLINMDRSHDRLLNSQNNFYKAGLPFEKIPAVDGNTLNMSKANEFAVMGALEEHKWITPAVIGCSLSHYHAYKQLLDTDAEWGLIVEDDVEFSLDIIDVLNSAVHIANDTDVFLLYFHGKEKEFSRHELKKVTDNHAFYAAMALGAEYSTGAYLLHRNVARKLHAYVFPVHISADSWAVFYRDGVIGGLWALLPPVSRAANFGSDIGYSRVGTIFRELEKIKMLPMGRLTRWLRRVHNKTNSKYRIVDKVPDWLKG